MKKYDKKILSNFSKNMFCRLKLAKLLFCVKKSLGEVNCISFNFILLLILKISIVTLYEAINDSKTDEATVKISETKKNKKKIKLKITASEFIILDT